jgi:hydroxyethylthiazole kinase-like uncharacterized protein yjeF
MRIVTQREMKEIEQKSVDSFFLTEELIVENVGISISQKMVEDVLKDSNIPLVFLIGKGSNGADGLSLARHLSNRGFSVRAFLLAGLNDLSKTCRKQYDLAQAFGVKISVLEKLDDLRAYVYHSSIYPIIVDAIFGTGVRLPLPNFIYDVISFVNEYNSYMVAIDIPSGVSGDSGLIEGNAIKADLTYAVGLPKLGSFLADGTMLSGHVVVVEGGFPSPLLQEGDKFQVELKDVSDIFKSRSKFGDKRIFGHSMVLGGSHGLTGALVLASQAALKVGAGLVTGATWEAQYQEYLSRLIPEVMTGYIPTDEEKWAPLLANFGKYDSMVIGPGLGVSARSRRAVITVLSNFQGPVVIDADGINVLNINEDRGLFQGRTNPTIITPHFGEFARLIGVTVSDVEKQTVELLQKCVSELNCTVILKGPCTYMAFPSGSIYFNFSPNAGMATGGTGDVLAGILGGVLAQDQSLKKNNNLYEKVVSIDRTVLLGVLLHSRAGHFAATELGERAMTASSIIEFLSHAYVELEKVTG